MAVEYALLDLYHLFVEVLFGNFFLAVIGIGILFEIFCFLFKMSLVLSLSILTLYFLCMFAGFYGSAVAIFLFFFVASYFAVALIRWIQGGIAA